MSCMKGNRTWEREVDVEKDGNCFFRCLSLHFYNTEDRHPEVREQTARFLLKHRDSYQQYVDGNMQDHIKT